METIALPRRAFIVQQMKDQNYDAVRLLDNVADVAPILTTYFRIDKTENVLNAMRKYIAAAHVNDILIVSGHPFLNMLALVAWFERHPVVTLGVWNKDDERYYLHTVNRPTPIE